MSYSDDLTTDNFQEDAILLQTVYPSLSCQANTTKMPFCLEYNSTTLNCADIPNEIFKCIDGKVKILDCYCANYNPKNGTIEFGKCFYNCNRVQRSLFDDPYNSLTVLYGSNLREPCQEASRSGTLCGKCKNNSFPLVYSYNLSCVNCTDYKTNVGLYLLEVYLPLTVFCVCIVLLKVNATASHLEGFILICQGLSLPVIARILSLAYRYEQASFINGVNALLTVYGIWNLDIFRALNRTLCLSLDTLSAFSLDLAVGAYPLLFITVVYFMSNLSKKFQCLEKIVKPLGYIHRFFKVNTSLIDAFGTLLVLSHVKFMNVCFDLLLSTEVHILPNSGNLTSGLRWYYDASIVYFGDEHKPLAILSIFVLLFSAGLPTLFLTIYPFKVFHQCLNKITFRWYVLHTFMDMFHACYKDGTEPGTQDCRWFVGVLLTFRFTLYLTGFLTLNAVFFPYASILLVILAISILLIQPYKENRGRHSFSNLMFIILLASFYTSLCFIIEADRSHHRLIRIFYAVALVFAITPLLYLCCLIIYGLVKTILRSFFLMPKHSD